MSNKIKKVKFVKNKFQTEVLVTFEDDSFLTLFSYYPDELSFTEDEFIGLTVQEALSLVHKKDKEYLRD